MLVFDIVCSLLIPVAYIVVGLIFWKGGPFKRNDMAGWRTKLAMRSQETWNFANTYGGRAFFILGIGTLSVTIILMFLLSGAKQSLKDLMTVVFVVMQTFLLIPCYRKVEKEIKKLSDKKD